MLHEGREALRFIRCIGGYRTQQVADNETETAAKTGSLEPPAALERLQVTS